MSARDDFVPGSNRDRSALEPALEENLASRPRVDLRGVAGSLAVGVHVQYRRRRRHNRSASGAVTRRTTLVNESRSIVNNFKRQMEQNAPRDRPVSPARCQLEMSSRLQGLGAISPRGEERG